MKLTKITLSLAAALFMGAVSSSAHSSNSGVLVFDKLISELDAGSVHYTKGGAFNSSQGRHWSGGSLSIRVQQRPPRNIATFTAPSISGGCGGIDIYGGGFNLISGDELVQMARGAMQGAAYYFFSMALKSLSAQAGNIADDLQKKLAEMNENLRFDCQSVVNGVTNHYKSISEMKNKKADEAGAAEGTSSANKSYVGEGVTPSNTSLAVLESQNANVVVQTMAQLASELDVGLGAGVLETFTNAIGSEYASLSNAIANEGNQKVALLIMALAGTGVNNSITDEDECNALEADGKSCLVYEEFLPSIKYVDLAFNGVKGGTEYYTCATNDKWCSEIRKKALGQTDGIGSLLDYVRELLSGNETEEGLLTMLQQVRNKADLTNLYNSNDVFARHRGSLYDLLNTNLIAIAASAVQQDGISYEASSDQLALMVVNSIINGMYSQIHKALESKVADDPTIAWMDGETRRKVLRNHLDNFEEYRKEVGLRNEQFSAAMAHAQIINDIINGG